MREEPPSFCLHRARIRPEALASVLRDWRAADGAEPCGLLLGRIDGPVVTVDAVHATTNDHPSPERAFRVSPEAQLSGVREARARGLEVVGAWHGHLVGPPLPGRADVEGLRGQEEVAGAPRAALIVGRGGGYAPVVRCYATRKTCVREIPLRL